MVGYRTYLVAGATLLAGILARWGWNVDPEIIATTVVIVFPAIMALMRSITKTAPGGK